jgi:hypothetical protein
VRRNKKPILCRLGFHKPDRLNPVYTTIVKGRHKWRTTHIVCSRCGKKLWRVTWKGASDEQRRAD